MHGGRDPETPRRKLEHIEIVLEEEVEWGSTWLEYVVLPHRSLPEADLEAVDLGLEFLGRELGYPLVVTGMTGGHPDTVKINARLAEAAEEKGIAMGVGSQRAAIEHPELEYTFRVVREKAPSIPLIANIGAVQLAKGYGVRELEKAVEMIDADAIAIHLNPAQEAFQPEGDTSFTGLIGRICSIAQDLSVPVMVKETGSGLSMEVVSALHRCGIRYYDTGGVGGTSWVAVEMYRAARRGRLDLADAARSFLDWGLPTAASILETRHAAPDSVIIGSGGVRTGLDAAKAIALGADLAGFARPALVALLRGGSEGLSRFLDSMIYGLRVAAFLSGCSNYQCLRRIRPVIRGALAEWARSRGISTY